MNPRPSMGGEIQLQHMFDYLLAAISAIFLTLSPTPTPPSKFTFPLSTTVLSTGDVLLARTINSRAVAQNDFLFPFAQLQSFLSGVDITFINLENPLPKNCPVVTTGTVFCGDQRHIQGLKFAGIDVVNLANNHASNYGPTGLSQTVDLLTQNGLPVVGLGQPVVVTKNGLKIAFLGFNASGGSRPPITEATDASITAQVSQAAAAANVVIVQFHWGTEYTATPTSWQRRLAHLAVDSGADLVIGNHPHWVQPVEYYKQAPVIYSHGNFIFDQYWSDATRRGLVSLATFTGSQLTDLQLLPIYISSVGQPRLIPK